MSVSLIIDIISIQKQTILPLSFLCVSCNHKGVWDKDNMGIVATDGDTPPHLRYSYFSHHTKVLQMLAYQVCPKVLLGIGSAERRGRNARGT